MQLDRELEIDKNFEYFQGIVGSLVPKHLGKYAVLHNCKVVSYFNTSAEALIEGYKKYPDGMFSVQEVVAAPLDLGFYSHVASVGNDHK